MQANNRQPTPNVQIMDKIVSLTRMVTCIACVTLGSLILQRRKMKRRHCLPSRFSSIDRACHSMVYSCATFARSVLRSPFIGIYSKHVGTYSSIQKENCVFLFTDFSSHSHAIRGKDIHSDTYM